MDWNQLKEKAKEIGYNEEPILENGIVWLTKKRLYFDLCFNNDGMVLLDGDEEYILAKERTPEQMLMIMMGLE